jgi:hypothetical protein
VSHNSVLSSPVSTSQIQVNKRGGKPICRPPNRSPPPLQSSKVVTPLHQENYTQPGNHLCLYCQETSYKIFLCCEYQKDKISVNVNATTILEEDHYDFENNHNDNDCEKEERNCSLHQHYPSLPIHWVLTPMWKITVKKVNIYESPIITVQSSEKTYPPTTRHWYHL